MTPEPTLAKLAGPLPDPVPDWPTIDLGASVGSAGLMVSESRASGLVVTQQNMPVGIVSVFELLRVLSLDIDAVTSLPRSGALRDWLAEQLRAGSEVTVLFMDLDDFGEVNKADGHPAGDLLLSRVAQAILAQSGEREFVSRFGGDEFAIGSLRSRADSDRWVATLEPALGHPASIGIAGGRRTEVREDMNVGSTVEELLRLASLECLHTKEIRKKMRERL